MARFIPVIGSEREIHPADPKEGFQLDELYKLLNCDIVQAIRLKNNQRMIMDEEGKLKGDEVGFNLSATKEFMDSLFPNDVIVGDVLVVDDHEFL